MKEIKFKNVDFLNYWNIVPTQFYQQMDENGEKYMQKYVDEEQASMYTMVVQQDVAL